MWYDFFNNTNHGIVMTNGEELGVSFHLADAYVHDMQELNVSIYTATKTLIQEHSVDAIIVGYGEGVCVCVCISH